MAGKAPSGMEKDSWSFAHPALFAVIHPIPEISAIVEILPAQNEGGVDTAKP